MTTIGSTAYFVSASRPAGAGRSQADSGFADQLERETAQQDSTQPDKLASLLNELEELKTRQLQMSNSEYLSAKFGLQEQISSERLDAGEDLDTIGVRFEDRVFQLAGKMYDLSALKAAKLPDGEMVRIAKPEDFQRQNGFDVSA